MTMVKSGKVYLIGAGPGDPGLITVKGQNLLNRCDAILYDNLVSLEIIISIPEHIEKHYVGKKANRHAVPQERINKMLWQLARDGKTVGRIKGSDPLIFGRGGEEAKYLKEHGIEFEIVPGITAGIAAPAYAGIPCTDRERASYVIFATGHKASGKIKSSIPWNWVAQSKNGTVVIYMGVGEAENIGKQLIEHGMSADTPLGVIERGTFPSQRVFTSQLDDLPQLIARENIIPPSLLILGEVVNMRQWLDWFGNRPLMGLRVMVTRAANQAGELYNKLRELGAEPLPYPSIAIKSFEDVNGWETMKNINRENRWLIFTSENGVRCFFDKLPKKIGDIRQLNGYKIAAIGAGTAQRLKANNLMIDYIPSSANVKTIVEEMPNKVDLKDAVIVRVRGNLADTIIEDSFSELCAEIIPLTVYETYHPVWPEGFKEKLFEHPPEVIMFTSGSTMKGLHHNLSKEEAEIIVSGAEIFSIGPKTTATLESEGLKITKQAKEHTIDGLLDELLDYYKD